MEQEKALWEGESEEMKFFINQMMKLQSNFDKRTTDLLERILLLEEKLQDLEYKP